MILEGGRQRYMTTMIEYKMRKKDKQFVICIIPSVPGPVILSLEVQTVAGYCLLPIYVIHLPLITETCINS